MLLVSTVLNDNRWNHSSPDHVLLGTGARSYCAHRVRCTSLTGYSEMVCELGAAHIHRIHGCLCDVSNW